MNSQTLSEPVAVATPQRVRRPQLHLSTLVVAVLTTGVLLGINMRPYNFYYPRPEWMQELKSFVKSDDPSDADPWGRWGLYGWPCTAFPSWNWCGNGEGFSYAYPHWTQYGAGASDIRIACNWPKWNFRALWIDVGVNAAVILAAGFIWEIYMRARFRRRSAA